jgi:hypothetical protein
MWNITSDNIQRAKDRIEVRRVEIETRYAEDKQALDAELAVVETLEHAAAEFMLKQTGVSSVMASGLAMSIDPRERGSQQSNGEDGGDASRSAPQPDRGEAESGLEASAQHPLPQNGPAAGAGDTAAGLDILKPGSRWRLYRGINRPGDSEGIAGEASPPAD